MSHTISTHVHFQYYKTKKKIIPQDESSMVSGTKFGTKFGAKFGSMPNLSSGYTEAVLTSTTNTASHLRSAFNREKKKMYDR